MLYLLVIVIYDNVVLVTSAVEYTTKIDNMSMEYKYQLAELVIIELLVELLLIEVVTLTKYMYIRNSNIVL